MNEIETKQRLRTFLVDEGHWFAPREKLGEDLPIISTILDSVGLVNLVAMVEDEFGIEVRDEDLDFENFGTIARIAAYIERAKSAARN
jgi:acyl carrier protein